MKTLRSEFVLVKEAANLLGVCPNTVRSWGAAGKLTEYRHPINDYRMFKKSELRAIIEQMSKPHKPKPK